MNRLDLDGDIAWYSVSSYMVKNALKGMSGDVLININSGGGSVFEGIEIFNSIRAYTRGIITTRITGLGASMGSYIALAGDKIEVMANATMMIHNASIFSNGDHNQLRDDANIAEGLSNLLSKEYQNKTGKSEADIKALMDAETWMFGDEIVKEGFADVVIEDATAKTDKTTALTLGKERFKATIKKAKEKLEDESKELVAYFPNAKTKQGEKKVIKTIEELQKEYPELTSQIMASAKSEGIKAETARISSIDAEKVVGHDSIVAIIKADSTKTVTDLKLAVYEADKVSAKNKIKELDTDNKDLLELSKNINSSSQTEAEKKAKADSDIKARFAKAGKKERGEK